MNKLIRFEFRKAFTTRLFYIMLGLSIAMAIITLRTYYSQGIGSIQYNGLVSLARAFDNSNLAMFIGILTAIFICDDYNNGTIRNIVTRGYSRTQIYFAKLIVLCVLCIIILNVCWIVSGIVGFAQWKQETGVINLSFLNSMAAQFMITLAFACFFCAISSALQKTGAAIAVCLVIPFAMLLILGFIDVSMAAEDASGVLLLEQYWLGDMVASIGTVDVDSETLHRVFTVTPIYIVLSSVLGWLAVLKREY